MNRTKLYLLIYWVVMTAGIIALTHWAACRASGAVSDCLDASCRITTPDGSRGSGCVFEISQGRVFVLTAAHVVGASPTVQCEFWRRGHQSRPLQGSVIARVENDRCDAAVVSLSQSQFGGLLPRVVPVAPRDTVLRPGQTITSVGCAKGSWSTGWKGHVLGYSGGDLHFRPTPADGRSGSAIFDAEGTMIVGLLRARTTNGSQGIACSLTTLYAGLGAKGGRATKTVDRPAGLTAGTSTQFGPGGCPGGICPSPSPYSSPSQQPYLLPYRRQQQQQQNPVWPTLPSPTPAPAENRQLDRLNEKMDQLLDILRTQRQPVPMPGPAPYPIDPMPAMPPATPPDDSLARQVAEEAKTTASEAKQEVQATREEQSKLRTAVDALVGDHRTLKERFNDRIAKVKEELGPDAGRVQIARAYAKDLAAEKLGGGAGWSIGKLLAGSLGLSGPVALGIAAAGFFAARRVKGKLEAGDPLLIQRVVGHLGEKIDDLKDRLRDQPPAATTGRRKAK